MSLKSWLPAKEVTSPRGAWTVLANKRKGRPDRASILVNSRVAPGTVGSRPGTNPIVPALGQVKGIWNWLAPNGVNWVLYRDGTVIRALNQPSTFSVLLSDTGAMYRPSFADTDVWAYFCGCDVTGAGTTLVTIFDGANTDLAFRGPISGLTGFTAADTGVGQSTLGTHNFGFVYQNRTGYSTTPATDPSFTVTLAASLRQITITVTVPPQMDGGMDANGGIQATLFLIATPANNPAQWFFVPPAVSPSTTVEQQPIPFNQAVTLTFIYDLSDEALYQSDQALDQFNLLNQGTWGANAIFPQFIVPYGTRMMYANGNKLYASDEENPQSIAADRNQVFLPNQRYIGAGFALPGGTSFYVMGDHWTVYVTDNTDTPSTWSAPISISQALGAPFQNCICYKTGGNYAWVVTEGGPYLFNGAFDEKPISYLVSDQWARVNWKAAYAIEIADDSANLRLYIAVPLDGATEPTAVFVFDYQNGMEFDSCDFSIDSYNPAFFANISSVGIVKEVATDNTNLWIGPTVAGSIIHFDGTTHNDQGAAMLTYWKSGLMRGNEIPTKLIRVGACDVWVIGNGPALIEVASLDGLVTLNPPLMLQAGTPVNLSPNPGYTYATRFDLAHVESYTFQIGTNSIDGWWELSGLQAYQKADLTGR